MGRKKHKYQLKRNVYVPWEMFESEAFKKLNTSSIRVLLRFLQKRTWSRIKVHGKPKNVYENSGLVFPYAEAETLGIKTTAFYEAIKKLVAIGFVDIEHQGGTFGHDYSRYAISERWRDYGTEHFKTVEKKRSLPRGHDVRSNMQKTKVTSETRSGPLRKREGIEQVAQV
jgi:DNA-binding PadR family transcriptional regulator